MKILLADDTRTWLFFHKEIIKQLYGDIFEFTECDSALKAWNLIHNDLLHPFDIIITDLQMENDYEPLTAGEWLIENIKKTNSYASTKIIIISAMSNIEYIAKQYNVECISKQRLLNNKLLMKYMLEHLMPHLKELNRH